MQKVTDFLRRDMTKKVGEWLGVVLILAWCGVVVARPINLATADLGRHLQNGNIWLNDAANRWAMLHTNFYSYTNTKFAFVNHHWASGVVFYEIFKLTGFSGLSIAYIALTLCTFFVYFRMAQKSAGTIFAGLIAVLVVPIAASRKEVRPEVFTYLFSGIFYWILLDWFQNRSNLKSGRRGMALLRLLPLIMLVWVNLHIGFIVGIGIVGVFGLVELTTFLWSVLGYKPLSSSGSRTNLLQIIFRDDRTARLRQLSTILLLTIAAALVNPWGLIGMLYPLNIFRNYGYLVVENQSIFFLQRLHFGTGLYFGFFEALVAMVMASFVWVGIKAWLARKKTDAYLEIGGIDGRLLAVNFILFITFASMAILAIRDFPLFGLFALPILAYNIKVILPDNLHYAYRRVFLGAAIALLFGIVLRVSQDLNAQGETFGIGLAPHVADAANFYLGNNIQGPVFDDYDIGGYLIYYLHNTGQKVFVDNRPEAYPVAFLQNIYIPAQQDQQKFKQLDQHYSFNSIFFSRNDATPWAQQFLIAMIQNPDWAPVYVDGYSIIFLKRNAQNQPIIQQHELPKSMFGITTE